MFLGASHSIICDIYTTPQNDTMSQHPRTFAVAKKKKGWYVEIAHIERSTVPKAESAPASLFPVLYTLAIVVLCGRLQEGR
jgi:hypothetical protein